MQGTNFVDSHEIIDQKHISKLDAEGFVRAILKDAQTGETTLL